MKKIILFSLLLTYINSFAQRADTVNASVTLRAQDWAWGISKIGVGSDSATRAKIRVIRDAVRAANPPSWTTNVTINNVNGVIILGLYKEWMSCPAGVMLNMGTNQAERATIYTTIRAINNPAIQYFIGAMDANALGIYNSERNTGKQILIDN
jgi:hypothetical protein